MTRGGRSGWEGRKGSQIQPSRRQRAASGMTCARRPGSTRAGQFFAHRVLAGAGLIIGGLGLTGCWGESFSWNQKLTVVVQTPSGERTGSAVSRVETYVGTMPMSGSGASASFVGEATVVEVAPDTYLSATVGEGTKNLALRVWGPEIPVRDTEDKLRVIERKRESTALTPDLYPLLVTFGNLNDPISVKEVDPANLAATFGPGYALKSITLEITDEQMTKGMVEKLLPWLAGIGRQRCCLIPNDKWGRNPTLNSVAPSDFSTELYK